MAVMDRLAEVWMNRRIASGLAAALAPGCNPDSMESESDASNADIAKVSANFYALAVAPDESWYARGSGLEITLAPLP